MAYIKKNPRVAIIAAVLLVLMLGIATWILTAGLRTHGRGAIGLHVYFYDADAGMLVGVSRTIPAGEHLAQVNSLLNSFCNPPSGLQGLWPAGTQRVALDYYEGTVGIVLSAEHRVVPAMYEALFRTALSLTFLHLPFVEEVIFWVYGDGDKNGVPFETWLRNEEYRDPTAIRIETVATVDNNPTITPGVIRERAVTLYFLDTQGEKLFTQTFVEYVDIHRWIEFTVDMLIAGPDEDNGMRIIPPETRVRWVVRDRSTGVNSVYIDLSGDFVSRFEGTPQQAGLLIQSIANTLTLNVNNPDGWGAPVNNVFFLVDGDRYETFHGVLDFNLAFTYNHEIRLDGVYQPEPYDPYDPYDPYYDEDVTVGPRGDDDE